MSTLSLTGAGPTSGGVAAFDPLSLSPAAWYKADAGTGATNDGDSVTTWTDQSGNSRNPTQPTAAKKPTYKTNIQNGLPVVRFDGVDDGLIAGSVVLSQPLEVFIVVKYTATRVGNDTAFDGGTNKMRFFRSGATQMGMYSGNAVAPTATIDPQAAFHVYTCLFSGASSELRVDGGSANTGNPGTSATSELDLGWQGTGEWGPVDIGEYLLYNTTLSAGNRAAVEGYLKTRWGTP